MAPLTEMVHCHCSDCRKRHGAAFASQHGFWLLVRGRERFKDAPVAQLLNVELPHPTHLYWPDLDVDLSVESIEFPERFPLVSRTRPDNALKRTRARQALKSVKRSRGARR